MAREDSFAVASTPHAYKGKGVGMAGEVLRLKVGKSACKVRSVNDD